MMIGTTEYVLTSFEIITGGIVMLTIGFICGIVAVIAAMVMICANVDTKKKTEEPTIIKQEVTQKRRRRRSQ